MTTSHTFVGRVEELQLLARCLHMSVEGQPQVVVFDGGPGFGKSALLQQFCRRAAEREKTGWVFPLAPPDEDSYLPVAQAAEAANILHRIGSRRKGVAVARDLLSTWVATVPVVGNLSAAVLETMDTLRKRRRRAVPSHLVPDEASRALLDQAVRHPIVVVCDDLHLVDEEGITSLERLCRGRAPGARLLFVGAYRSPARGEDIPPIQSLLRSLPEGEVHRRTLIELERGELEGWMRRRFPGIAIPGGFLDWLCERTGGHPLSVEEMVGSLIDSSVIRFADRHWQIDFVEDAPPADVDSAATPIIPSSLDRETLQLLSSASTFGDEFSGTALARLMQLDELEVEDRLAMAMHRDLVKSVGESVAPDGEVSSIYRFASPHLRSSLARAAAQGDGGGAIIDPPEI